jgi:hypothetical protein
MKPPTLESTMLKLFRKSQDVQRAWIRNHPIQYIVLNATLLVVWIGYLEYKDHKDKREFQAEVPKQA